MPVNRKKPFTASFLTPKADYKFEDPTDLEELLALLNENPALCSCIRYCTSSDLTVASHQ